VVVLDDEIADYWSGDEAGEGEEVGYGVNVFVAEFGL
jgi:hypothetical protein